MKIVISLALAALTLGSVAQASQQSICAFGESSWELKEVLEQDAEGKMWYQTGEITVDTEQRLKGLSSSEKDMVLLSQGYERNDQEATAAFEDFYTSDGYITYFSDRSGKRDFAMVASYPGDNEFGVVFEITAPKRGTNDIVILDPVAVISDGDFENCVITK